MEAAQMYVANYSTQITEVENDHRADIGNGRGAIPERLKNKHSITNTSQNIISLLKN